MPNAKRRKISSSSRCSSGSLTYRAGKPSPRGTSSGICFSCSIGYLLNFSCGLTASRRTGPCLIAEDALWTYRRFPKHSPRTFPFRLEKSIPIACDVSIFVGLRMVEKVTSSVCFGIMRGDDLITSAADVLFCVSDHDSPSICKLLCLSDASILNTPFKQVNPSENVFSLRMGCTKRVFIQAKTETGGRTIRRRCSTPTEQRTRSTTAQ